MFLGRETLEDNSHLPKKANKCSVGGGCKLFVAMYGGIGMSASSLHRESTDSLILEYDQHCGRAGATQSVDMRCAAEVV